MIDNGDGTVTLTVEQYRDIQQDLDFLDCLQSAGVDNWEGYDFAIEAYHQMHPDVDY